jgi:GNAT superfamily N-acetyltransferase
MLIHFHRLDSPPASSDFLSTESLSPPTKKRKYSTPPSSPPVQLSEPKKRRLAKKMPKFSQTYLNLGTPPNLSMECNICQEWYDPNNVSEQLKHSQGCKESINVKLTNHKHGSMLHESRKTDGEHRIWVINHSDKKFWRKSAYKALHLSEEELGHHNISEDQLWSQVPALLDSNAVTSDCKPVEPLFKVYLYAIDDEVVGFILAKRVAKAIGLSRGPNEPGPDDHPEFSREELHELSIEQGYKVYVCIERVWIHKDHRRKGLTSTLLNHVRDNFIPGKPLHRRDLAFSQLTEQGHELAKRYCHGVFPDGILYLVNNDA